MNRSHESSISKALSTGALRGWFKKHSAGSHGELKKEEKNGTADLSTVVSREDTKKEGKSDSVESAVPSPKFGSCPPVLMGSLKSNLPGVSGSWKSNPPTKSESLKSTPPVLLESLESSPPDPSFESSRTALVSVHSP